MAEKMHGIVINIGGDTTELSKALKEPNKEANALERELKQVDKALKLDPQNVTLLAQKQKILSDEIDSTKEKLKLLQTAKEQSDAAMQSGTEINQKAYRELQREIINTEAKLKSLNSQQKETEAAAKPLSILGEKMKETGNQISSVGKKLMPATTAIAGAATAAVAAAEGTREYREDMNRLEAAFVSSNKSAESAKKIYGDFYAVLGESDRSVEAVSHLAKLCETEEELSKWGDICAGVSATFGDSLPIEGLTEAANETSKTAKVTGVLADALNWIGISEDDFNTKLAACTSEQERSALITNTLSAAYNGAAKEFKTLNADVMESRKTTQDWTDTTAKLGEEIEPLTTDIKNMILGFVSEIVSFFTSLSDGQKKAVVAIAAVVAVIPPLILLVGSLTTATGTLFTLITAHPVGALVTALGLLSAGLVTAAVLSGDTESELRNLTEAANENAEAWENVKAQTAEAAQANVAEIDYTARLADELKTLADENGNVEEANRNRANFILNELNQAYGTEYTMIDGVIQQYGTLEQSIDDLIAKKRAEIILAAQEEEYKQAILAIDEERRNAAELEMQIEQTKQDILSRSGMTYEELMNLEGERSNLIKLAYKDEIAEIEEATAAREQANSRINEMLAVREGYESNYSAFLSGNAEEIAQINAGISESYAKTGNETEEELRKRVSVTGQVYADLLSEVEKGNANIRQSEIDAAAQSYNQVCIDYEKIGGAIPEGLKLGVENGTPTLQTGIASFITLLKALFTGKDGFDVNSPSKWSEGIGGWITEGLWNGINGKVGWLKAQVTSFLASIKAWFTGEDGFDVNSPSKWAKGIGQCVSEGLSLGISQSAYLAEDAVEKMFDELTDSEIEYFREKRALELAESDAEYAARLKNAKTSEEAEQIKQEALLRARETGSKEYLERLKSAAEEERKIIENNKKEISELYKEMAENASDSIEELEKAQEKLAEKLASYGSLYQKQTTTFKGQGERGEDLIFEEYRLADLSAQTAKLTDYKNNLLAVKNRGIEIPSDFFDMLRDLSIEEGSNFTGALLSASDEDFFDYIESWKEKQSAAQDIAKELYADEASSLAAEIKKSFDVLPEDFVAYGGYSADSFGTGFMEQLEIVMRDVRSKILEEMQKLFSVVSDSEFSQSIALPSASGSKLLKVFSGDAASGKSSESRTQAKSGITVTNNNYGVTAQTAYEVSEGTRRTLNALSMQGVL